MCVEPLFPNEGQPRGGEQRAAELIAISRRPHTWQLLSVLCRCNWVAGGGRISEGISFAYHWIKWYKMYESAIESSNPFPFFSDSGAILMVVPNKWQHTLQKMIQRTFNGTGWRSEESVFLSLIRSASGCILVAWSCMIIIQRITAPLVNWRSQKAAQKALQSSELRELLPLGSFCGQRSFPVAYWLIDAFQLVAVQVLIPQWGLRLVCFTWLRCEGTWHGTSMNINDIEWPSTIWGEWFFWY